MSSQQENIIPFLKRTSGYRNVLIVEDDRLQAMALEEQVKDMGFRTKVVANGQEAMSVLNDRGVHVDMVIMDRMMPVMDGLTAILQMKESKWLRNIPVIMVTGASTEKDMQEGLEAGVFYYLQKPAKPDVLRSVLLAATRELQQRQDIQQENLHYASGLTSLQSARLTCHTIREAESLTPFLASLFPEPERVLTGIAELLINAVEHGNLGIGYELKTKLIEQDLWRTEIERRQNDPAFFNALVDIVFARKDDGVYLVITDMGEGFDWRKYLMIDPSRAGDSHGRGIAQARAISFDKLSYNEKGNQVLAFVSNEKSFEW